VRITHVRKETKKDTTQEEAEHIIFVTDRYKA